MIAINVEDAISRKIETLRQMLGKASDEPELYATIGKYFIENPDVFGCLMANTISGFSELQRDNDIHKNNANIINEFMRGTQVNLENLRKIASHNDTVFDDEIHKLQQELSMLKNSNANNPVCECGHLHGDHTGIGNCVQCSCQVFKAKGGK